MVRPGFDDPADQKWFDTNAPPATSLAAYQQTIPSTNLSGRPSGAQLDAAYLKYLGRARGAGENTYAQDPNFESNLQKTEEAANYAHRTQAPAGGPGGMSAKAFIAQWQQSHPANAGIGPLADALKTAGYTNVSRFMYGATPSNNELNVDGEKFKVLSGEDSPNPSWYTAGSNDSGGGSGGGGQGQPFTPPAFQPSAAWTEKFQGPTQADLDADTSYTEQLKRGQQAIERSAASRGTVLNPGTLKDLSDWSQGTASAEMDKLYGRKSQEYGQRYQQYVQGVQQQAADQARQYQQSAGTFGINYGVWNDDVNRFINAQNTAFNQNLSLANLGMNGANGVTNAGSNFANQGGQNITGGADATAAGVVGSANAITDAIGSTINTGTSLYGLSRYGRPSYTGNVEGYQW